MTRPASRWLLFSKDWFKPAKRNDGVNELYLWCEVYCFGVLVSWPCTHQQMLQSLEFYEFDAKAHQLGELRPHGAKYITDRGDGRHWIYFTKETCAKPQHIVHECFHCVAEAMIQRGISPGPDAGDEAWAYLTGWLTARVMERMLTVG